MIKELYEFRFPVRNSDIDVNDTLTPTAILEFFQDAGGAHADKIGVGYSTMIARDLIWIIVSTKFQMYSNVAMGDELIIRSWPVPCNRIEFFRNYELLTPTGELVATGQSKWVVINIKSRRLVRASDVKFDLDHYYEKELFPEGFGKVEDFDFVALEKKDYYIGFSQLDHNLHMNNTKYANLIADALSLKKGEKIDTFQIDYLKECQEGDTLSIAQEKNDKQSNFVGIKNDGTVCFKATITLK